MAMMIGNDKFEGLSGKLIVGRSSKFDLFSKELDHRYVLQKFKLHSLRIKKTAAS